MNFSVNRIRIPIITAVFIFLMINFWEPGLGLSSTTYGSFAENIIRGQNLFRFNLSKGIFDPFVDHPPLMIWFQALSFKIFGVSSISLRFPSIFFAYVTFLSLFEISRKVLNLRAAAFSVICHLLINAFMNHSSSGWLDLGMVYC